MSTKSITSPDIERLISKGDIKGYLVFSLNGNYFGVPEEQFTNVIEFKNYSVVPGAPDIIIGVTKVRNRITTVINIKKILKLKSDQSSSQKGKIIFVKFVNDIIGVLVDEVIGFQYISNDNIKNQIPMFSSKIENKYLIGATIIENDIVLLFNLDSILKEYEIGEIVRSRIQVENFSKQKNKNDNLEETSYKLNFSMDDFQEYADIK